MDIFKYFVKLKIYPVIQVGYDLEKLSPEERARLLELLDKAEVPDEPTATNGGSPLPSTDDPNRAWGEAPAANPGDIEVKVIPDPDEWVERQISTLQAVGRQNYLQGIKRPKADPIKAGLDAQARYEEQMRKEEVLKRRAENLAKVSSAEWLAMAETLGADKLVDGVVKRRYKVERFVGKFHPLLKSHVEKIRSMPNVTDAEREQRMLENLRGLKKLKGKAK